MHAISPEKPVLPTATRGWSGFCCTLAIGGALFLVPFTLFNFAPRLALSVVAGAATVGLVLGVLAVPVLLLAVGCCACSELRRECGDASTVRSRLLHTLSQ